jgi:uncharacterized protein (TIGR00290 family)
LENILLSWSSGKDSAWALHLLSKLPEIHVTALFTTFNSAADRVAMHAVRRSLVQEQAAAVGLPLWPIELPWPCTNLDYENLLSPIFQRAREEGITAVAFGDLFLEDIRAYRERQLAGTGLKALFPLWQLPTPALAADMIAAGVRAKITCLDPTKLDRSFAGRDFDSSFLRDIPRSVDPCGENGEFHTFVYESPVFRRPVPVKAGDIVERDGFVFADVLEESNAVASSNGRREHFVTAPLSAGSNHSTLWPRISQAETAESHACSSGREDSMPL